MASTRLPNVLLFGTGEYTTGCVDGAISTSDKPMGVVALTFFDLRARGLVGPRIALCGRSGKRTQLIRDHFASTIAATYGLDVSCDIYPASSDLVDPLAYLSVLGSGHFVPGDLAVVTTPDDTHADIAAACIARGLHVIIAKPIVQNLKQHWNLIKNMEEWDNKAAEQAAAAAALPSGSDAVVAAPVAAPMPLVVVGEFHKRFDPLYADAISRISSGSLGDLSYFHAYMSQPKSQLDTFRSWLVGPSSSSTETAGGKATARAAPSDISYYLNSHHLDMLHLATAGRSRPIWVQAIAAKGCANAMFNAPSAASASSSSAPKSKIVIEDTITITVQYAHRPRGAAASSAAAASNGDAAAAASGVEAEAESFGIGIFTSSWIAPRSDVHTQQRFHYLGEVGEVAIDQGHRGYSFASDSAAAAAKPGVQSLNPLFMRYTPSTEGAFIGQQGYGYRSFEHFVEAARGMRSSALSPIAKLESPTMLCTTAVLEAARISLDQNNRKVNILYDQQRRPIGLE